MHRLAEVVHRRQGWVFVCSCGERGPELPKADAQEVFHDHALGLRCPTLDEMIAASEQAWTVIENGWRQWAEQQERFAPWPEWTQRGALTA